MWQTSTYEANFTFPWFKSIFIGARKGSQSLHIILQTFSGCQFEKDTEQNLDYCRSIFQVYNDNGTTFPTVTI